MYIILFTWVFRVVIDHLWLFPVACWCRGSWRKWLAEEICSSEWKAFDGVLFLQSLCICDLFSCRAAYKCQILLNISTMYFSIICME